MSALPFEDTSIRQGVREWTDQAGEQWRAVKDGPGLWKVFQLEHGAFIFQATVRSADSTPRGIHRAYAGKVAP
jgi:hypothetical protein